MGNLIKRNTPIVTRAQKSLTEIMAGRSLREFQAYLNESINPLARISHMTISDWLKGARPTARSLQIIIEAYPDGDKRRNFAMSLLKEIDPQSFAVLTQARRERAKQATTEAA